MARPKQKNKPSLERISISIEKKTKANMRKQADAVGVSISALVNDTFKPGRKP